jgi:iron complex outermembrane receptor protein
VTLQLATLLCAVTTELLTAPALAEEASEPDFASQSLEELMQVKIPTVTAASKHEQKTTEAPSSVSVVTRNDIEQFGYRTLSDILNSVRGFYISSDQIYNYIGGRGAQRPGDYGGRVLIQVNGQASISLRPVRRLGNGVACSGSWNWCSSG